MYSEKELDLITFCLSDAVNPNIMYALSAELGKPAPDLERFGKYLGKNLSAAEYAKVKAEFRDSAFRARVLENLGKKGVTCVTRYSENYPALLKQTADPPAVLFCKGNAALLKTKCFAVVGSRRCPVKTAADARKISGGLSQVFTVVSGIAEGGDTAAVEGALSKGNVICVLAYGFDYAYPAMNAQLLKQVEEKGLLISEYPPSVPPKSYQFPVRNRIIAGMSLGVLVVSAAKKSGALITADVAQQYDREIFAFPHPIGAVFGEGCNALIKGGAYLTENILDILSVFGLDLTLPKDEALSGDELSAYNILCEQGEQYLPALAEKMGKQVYQILPAISKLEIKGKVLRLGGNVFTALK